MGVLERFGAWLLTENGKKFVFGSAATGGITLLCAKVLPNTIFLDEYKDFVRLYKNGFTVPLTKSIQQRFDKTLDLLEIPEEDRKQFKPFFVINFDMFSAGTFYSRFGSIIGIPINFTYIDEGDIDTTHIKIRHESITWDTDDGKLLRKSLFVSEKAQLYGIAREIEMCKTPKLLFDTCYLIFTYSMAYGLGNYLNIKFNMLAKPRAYRFLIYGLVGIFSFANYCLLKDATQLYYERKIDEYLKNKNEVFREGGKEFYEKNIMRNIALRGLMGKEGKALYSVLGNENYLIRQKHLPLIQRKEFFENA